MIEEITEEQNPGSSSRGWAQVKIIKSKDTGRVRGETLRTWGKWLGFYHLLSAAGAKDTCAQGQVGVRRVMETPTVCRGDGTERVLLFVCLFIICYIFY